MKNLNKKNIIVTGASGGIGNAIIKILNLIYLSSIRLKILLKMPQMN